MANIDTAKSWFETGDYPTQAQFWQLFDWIRWKDEQLAISDITGLQTILNNAATINAVKALFRDKITLLADGNWSNPDGNVISGVIIKSVNNASIKIGTTPGGDDILSYDVVAGVPVAISLIYYSETAQTIYFSGISGSTDFIIIKNPL